MYDFHDLIIVGGGASGMAAAISAARMGDRILLLEKASALGRKIAVSGNGRCNLMNTHAPVYFGDTDFALEVLDHCTLQMLIRFWKSLGLLLSEDGEGRMYPCTFQSSSVLDALKTGLKQINVEICLQTSVSGIERSDAGFTVFSDKGRFPAKRVLIASGGPAAPKFGGSSSGYRLLEHFGHSVIPPRPSLCPILTDSLSISGLSGIRVRCSVTLRGSGDRVLCRQPGELLFTDYGISGICAMQCARFIEDEDCCISVDFVSHLFPDSSQLSDLLLYRRKQFSALPPQFLLNGILVPKLSFAVLKQAGISVKNCVTGDISDEQLHSVIRCLHAYTLKAKAAKGLENAQVTAGGARCREFIPATLESLLMPGLHAAGEVLNVDGDCGGYNLMFAFSSGILAGLNGRKGSL